MSAWQIGTRIQGRWEVQRVLHGGMGVIYIVYDHEWRGMFAAKSFREETLAIHPALAQRFEQEARLWIGLDFHPNIAQARMVHEIEGRPVLFIEYVAGGDLSGWIATPRLTDDPVQIIRFGLQFCDGMTHAWSKGVQVHRDIKPSNCLVTQNTTLKITDFGLAKAIADSVEANEAGRTVKDRFAQPAHGRSLTLSQTGVAVGTPAYMAPEQFEDAKRVDVRADLYAFGVMLFEMAAGHLPFQGQSWMNFYYLHNTRPAPPLEGKHSTLSDLVQRCLEKTPANRFSDFGEVRAEMAGVYRRLTGKEAPPPPAVSEVRAEEWNNKALSLHHLRRYKEALEGFDRALSLNPRLTRALSNKGVTLGQGMRRWAEALICLEEALRVDPEDSLAWSNKGMALRAMRQPGQALLCYDRALQLDAHADATWSNKGVALKELGRASEALACVERALVLNPGSADTWSNMGQILADAFGKHQEALDCYSRALELDPRNETAWSNKGATLLGLGRAEEAVSCIDRALKIRDFERAWLNRGAALGALGRHEEALVCHDRAIELDASYVKAWTNKGNTLTRLHRYPEAIVCYDRAIQLSPRNAAAWFNKGVTLLTTADTDKAPEIDEALTCLEQARRLGHPEALRTLAALKGPR